MRHKNVPTAPSMQGSPGLHSADGSGCRRKGHRPLQAAWKEVPPPFSLLPISLLSYPSWGSANDPAVYTDCTVLNAQRGPKIYYPMLAINNSPRRVSPDAKTDGIQKIKVQVQQRKTPASHYGCKSKKLCASLVTHVDSARKHL